MSFDVILSRKNDKYVTRVKEWPEVVTEDQTREEALLQVKEQPVEYLTHQIEVVQVDVDLPTDVDLSGKAGNSWLNNFGRFKTDPAFEYLQSEIAGYRQELDGELENASE